MHINPTPLRFAEAGLHTHPFVRRLAASLTGALIALTLHAMYQDTTSVVTAMLHDDTVPIADDAEADAAARVRNFAEELKQQRAELSQ